MVVVIVTVAHVFPVAIKRFRAVTPPSIEALREELTVGIRPVIVASFWRECVIDRMFEHESL